MAGSAGLTTGGDSAIHQHRANPTITEALVRWLCAVGAALGAAVFLGVLDKMRGDWVTLNGWLSTFPFGFSAKSYDELILCYILPMLVVYAGSLVLPGPLASASYLIAAWGGHTLVQRVYTGYFRGLLPPDVSFVAGALPEYEYDAAFRWAVLVCFAVAMGALLKARIAKCKAYSKTGAGAHRGSGPSA